MVTPFVRKNNQSTTLTSFSSDTNEKPVTPTRKINEVNQKDSISPTKKKENSFFNSNNVSKDTNEKPVTPTRKINEVNQKDSISPTKKKENSFFNSNNVSKVQGSEINESAKTRSLPIKGPPEIDSPVNNPRRLSPPPPAKRRIAEIDNVPIREVEKIMNALSEKTLQHILAIVLKEQLEIGKQSLISADATFEVYEGFRKSKDQMLQEIKDVLLKDELFANKLQMPIQIAALASLVCGLASAAVNLGIKDLIEGTLTTTLGEPAGQIFKFTTEGLATLAPWIAVTTAGLKGVEGYGKLQLDQVTGKMVMVSYQEEFYNQRTDDGHNRIENISNSLSFYQDLLSKGEQRNRALHRLILQK